MTGFGVFLLLGAILSGLLGMIWFFAKLTDVIESGGFRALLRRNFEHYAERRVNTFLPAPSLTPDHSVKPEVLSASSASRQTDSHGVSEALQWIERMRLDRTRITLIELMVYTGWPVGEIRGLLKGDNTVLSAEIEQARRRLGVAEPPRVIPVSERGSPPRPLALDGELHYQPPPR